MKTPFFRAIFTIVRKDLRAELRSRELVSSMGLFALLSIIIFSFALDLDRAARESVVTGVLWMTIVFASIIGLNRSMAMEREQGNFDAMLIAPIDRTVIFFGKLIGNLVFALIVGLLLLPLMTLLFNISLLQPLFVLVLLLGIFGFSAIGTLLAAMTVQTRARESLLPIVMMPIALPVLLSAVKSCSSILNATPFADWIAWLQILAVVDIVYLITCYLLFPYVLEE
jgi:heme exporter protein B